jgi:hypothetical protein
MYTFFNVATAAAADINVSFMKWKLIITKFVLWWGRSKNIHTIKSKRMSETVKMKIKKNQWKDFFCKL